MARTQNQTGAVAEREARRDTPRPARKDVLQRQRDEFGGFHWGADFFGWLVAVGIATLLIALLAATGAAVGLTSADTSDATENATHDRHRRRRPAADRAARSPTTPAATSPAGWRASTARAKASACG